MKASKNIALTISLVTVLVISSLFAFVMGTRQQLGTQIPAQQSNKLENSYEVKKTKTSDISVFKYELWKGNELIFSITNMFGFSFDVSQDGKYIAIIIYGESMGDEQFTLITSEGKILKEFGLLQKSRSINPMMWIDSDFWLTEGFPIEAVSVIRVNAKTLEVTRYN